MSYSDNGGMLSAADVAAVTRNNGGGFGFGGDGAWWLIILFLFAFANNGGYGFNGGGTGNPMFYPWMTSNVTQNDVQRGFDQSAIMGGLNSITTAVSNGFANAEISRCNAQTNTLQALNGIGMSLQNCCCENRAGLADLKYTVATENCSDRAVVSNGIRDILTATQAQTQAILDKLCQQEIDALKAQNADLQTQVNLANLKASQTDQTLELKQYLNPSAVPAYIVANPYGCNQARAYGCSNC